jgi:hypothetical protein
VYGGNRPKALLANASAEIRALMAKRKFWLCEYGPVARMLDIVAKPLPWVKPTLWQFTGDGIGPQPHGLPGIVTQGIDLSSYAGTRDQLAKDWPG